MTRTLTVVLLSSAIVFCVSSTASAGFMLRVLVQEGDTIGGKTLTSIRGGLLGPSLNNNGEVAFEGLFSGGSGIFTQTRLVVQSGDMIDGKTLGSFGGSFGNPSLNDNGVVAFGGSFGTSSRDSGVFTQSSLLAEPGDTIDGKTLSSVQNGVPVLNNNGEVVFTATFSGGSGLFNQSNLLFQNGETFGGPFRVIVASVLSTSLNDNGDVAFRGNVFDSLNFIGNGIFTPSGPLFQPGDTIAGKTLSVFGNLSLNDNGDVAFEAFFSGGSGLFTQDSLLVQRGDTIDGQLLSSFAGRLSLNNNGDVAFGAFVSGGGKGIFTQDSLLIQEGDTIGGKLISSLGDPSLNDNGEIAFIAGFSDGSSALILAAPQQSAVPEPATVSLFFTGLLGLAGTAWRRRRGA